MGGGGTKKREGIEKTESALFAKFCTFFLFAREINTYWNVEPSD
jgi:hypothetical protein